MLYLLRQTADQRGALGAGGGPGGGDGVGGHTSDEPGGDRADDAAAALRVRVGDRGIVHAVFDDRAERAVAAVRGGHALEAVRPVVIDGARLFVAAAVQRVWAAVDDIVRIADDAGDLAVINAVDDGGEAHQLFRRGDIKLR